MADPMLTTQVQVPEPECFANRATQLQAKSVANCAKVRS
jgi:hypothetical protein